MQLQSESSNEKYQARITPKTLPAPSIITSFCIKLSTMLLVMKVNIKHLFSFQSVNIKDVRAFKKLSYISLLC